MAVKPLINVKTTTTTPTTTGVPSPANLQYQKNASNYERQIQTAQLKARMANAGNGVPGNGTTGTTSTSLPTSTSTQDSVSAIYDKMLQAQTDAYNANKNQAIGDINYQKQQVAPQYQGLRNQADVVSYQNAKRMQELMASRGLGPSGENVTATVGQNNARQQSLNNLNMQEQGTMNDFEHQIANLNDPAKLNALMSQINAQKAQALYDDQWKTKEFDNTNFWNNKNFGLSEAGVTGTYNGKDTMANTQRKQDNTFTEAGLTGMFNGKKTAAQSNADRGFGLDVAGVTGVYNGMKTAAQTNADRGFGLDVAGITGMYNGKPTMQKTISDREWNQMSPADKARMALQYSYSQRGKSSSSGGSSKSSSSTKSSSKGHTSLPKTTSSQQLSNAAKLYKNLMDNAKKGKTSSNLIHQPFKLSN